jgi:hypothetical protein
MEAIPKESTLRVGNFDDYVFEEDSEEDKREFEELKERMSKLVVHARAKVTKSRIYCAAYHPEVTKDLIFFGGEVYLPMLFCIEAIVKLTWGLSQTRKELLEFGMRVPRRTRMTTTTGKLWRMKTGKVASTGVYSCTGLQTPSRRFLASRLTP